MNLDNASDALGHIALWIGAGYLVGWWVWRYLHNAPRTSFFSHLETGMIGACLGSVVWHGMDMNSSQVISLSITFVTWLVGLVSETRAYHLPAQSLSPNVAWLIDWFFVGCAALVGAIGMTCFGRMVGWYALVNSTEWAEETLQVDSHTMPYDFASYESDERRVAAVTNRRRQTLRTLNVYITDETFPRSDQSCLTDLPVGNRGVLRPTSNDLRPDPATSANGLPVHSSTCQRHGVEIFAGIAPLDSPEYANHNQDSEQLVNKTNLPTSTTENKHSQEINRLITPLSKIASPEKPAVFSQNSIQRPISADKNNHAQASSTSRTTVLDEPIAIPDLKHVFYPKVFEDVIFLGHSTVGSGLVTLRFSRPIGHIHAN